LDITDQKSVDQLVSDLADRKVSVLVNCAGGAFDGASVLDSDPAVWSKTYDLNVVGTVRMVKAFTPAMQKLGHGHIVIISSTAGHTAYENGGSYVAAKHAETSLARTLRLELNGLPIRVTEIAPGMVKTEEFAKIRSNLQRFDLAMPIVLQKYMKVLTHRYWRKMLLKRLDGALPCLSTSM